MLVYTNTQVILKTNKVEDTIICLDASMKQLIYNTALQF